MTDDELRALQPGDLVRHKSDAKAMLVTGNHGDSVTAVRTAHLTNACEWVRVDAGGRVIGSDAGITRPHADALAAIGARSTPARPQHPPRGDGAPAPAWGGRGVPLGPSRP